MGAYVTLWLILVLRLNPSARFILMVADNAISPAQSVEEQSLMTEMSENN